MSIILFSELNNFIIYNTEYYLKNKNYSEAFKWCKYGSEQGIVELKYELGLLYIRGYGIKKNFHKGLQLIEDSSREGYLKATKKITINILLLFLIFLYNIYINLFIIF
jgi:TPR repeat protein